jgi:hypothetical protein
MNFRNTAKTTAVITLILIMASITLMAGKPVAAQYYDTDGQYHSTMGGPIPDGVTPDVSIPTQAFLAVSPDPVGVDQNILVNVWLTPALDVSRYHTGYTVTITKPNGDTETKTMNSYYADSTAWFNYVPKETGTYKFQFSFAGDYYAAGDYIENEGAVMLMGAPSRNVTFTQSMYYEPSSTPVTSITVQEEPVASWPPSPLPTEYWTRPISPENREWWQIAGNYPAIGQVGGGTDWPADTNPYPTSAYSFVPYVQAPDTAHVVWRKQIGDAGLLGGVHSTKSVLGGGFGAGPSVIYNGKAYEQTSLGGSYNILECYDIRTGEVYWQIPNPVPVFSMFGFTMLGSLYLSYAEGIAEVPGGSASSMSAGVSLVAIGDRLVKIDPFSGAVTLNVTGMSGTLYDDPYVLSVQTIGNPYYPYGGGDPPSYRLINWSMAGSDANFADRVVSNISWPLSSLPTTTDFDTGVAVSVVGVVPPTGTTEVTGTSLTAYSLTTGEKLWNLTDTDIPYCNGMVSIADHGKIAVLMIGQGYWKAWNLLTGKLAWTSEKMAYPWGEAAFGDYGQQSAYGLLYRESYDGVYAYNWTNGEIVWHFMAPSVPFETGYSGNYSFNGGGIVADGKLYTYNTEHTATNPITRGWRLFCINATTGEGIWNITGTMTPMALADGYLAASNGYDGYMYVFGKGQTATTVKAPDIGIQLGQSIMITGTVIDQSPGQQGTGCVSDASMTQWMEYIHMQKSFPTDVTGVPVTIDVLDSNGNYRNIGTATSDSSGAYGFAWQPDIPGTYQVIATFEGSASYWPSHAVTYFTVEETPEATPPPTPTPAPMTDMYLFGATASIIVAIAAVGLVLVLMLRKR